MHAAADEAYDALRQSGVRVPGLIRQAVEEHNPVARAELIEHLRQIEETTKRLRETLDQPVAWVEPDRPARTVGEWT